MNKRLDASEAEKRAKEQELLIKSQTNKVKLEEAKEDNKKLQEEIEAIVNGNKRSDIGLVGTRFFIIHFKLFPSDEILAVQDFFVCLMALQELHGSVFLSLSSLQIPNSFNSELDFILC